MSIQIDDTTGRVIDDTLIAPDEPPLFSARDHVVRIVTNEICQVTQGFWAADADGRYGWNYDCERVHVADSGKAIAPVCLGEVEILPEDELQPLPSRHKITAPRSQVTEAVPTIDLVARRPSTPSVRITPRKRHAPMIELGPQRLLPEKGDGS